MAAALEAGVTAAVPHRRRARRGGAGLRHRPRAARGQDRRPRQPLCRRREGAGRAPLRDRLLRRADRDRRSSPAPAGRHWIAADLDRAGRARSRRARDLHHLEPPARRSRRRGAVAAQQQAGRSSRQSLAAQRRGHRRRVSADEAMALANRFAPEHLVVDREALARRPLTGGRRLHRPLHRAGRRRLRDRVEPRAADRPARRGFAAGSPPPTSCA